MNMTSDDWEEFHHGDMLHQISRLQQQKISMRS